MPSCHLIVILILTYGSIYAINLGTEHGFRHLGNHGGHRIGLLGLAVHQNNNNFNRDCQIDFRFEGWRGS